MASLRLRDRGGGSCTRVDAERVQNGSRCAAEVERSWATVETETVPVVNSSATAERMRVKHDHAAASFGSSRGRDEAS